MREEDAVSAHLYYYHYASVGKLVVRSIPVPRPSQLGVPEHEADTFASVVPRLIPCCQRYIENLKAGWVRYIMYSRHIWCMRLDKDKLFSESTH